MQHHQLQRIHQAREEHQQQINAARHDHAISTNSGLQLHPEHATAVEATENHRNDVKTIRNHNIRLNTMMLWIQQNYSHQFDIMVRPLSDREKAQVEKYWKGTHDFIYDKIDVQIIKAFISANKIRTYADDGSPIYYGFDNMRKYKDAILFGSKRAEVPLSPRYNTIMKTFIDSLKKENQKKRKLGQVAESESDAITFPLYTQICKWAVNLGWIFLWAFTVMQWNCMARSINIDNLCFNCFSVGKDSLVVKFWDSKKDKKGEKTSPKNLYSNPFNYLICVTTALGCYLSIFDESFSTGKRSSIFLNEKAREGSASHKYCELLVSLFRKNESILYQYCRPGHANGHGIRKGSAVHTTSGTTCPPPPSSVARRGEWSLGKVFDIYWLFAEAGDQYCGRILAGLDPHSSSFEVLPPHFIEGLENEKIFQGLSICFYNIMKLQNIEGRVNIIGLLLRCLASLVHHSDALLEVIAKNPGHPFSQIPILNSPQLLSDLKPLVSIKPSSKIDSATGIPPHVKMMTKMSELLSLLQDERANRVALEDKLVETVEKSIEKNALNNGNITHSSVSQILRKHQDDMNKKIREQSSNIDNKLNNLITAITNGTTSHNHQSIVFGGEDSANENNNNNNIQRCLYNWDGKFWHVPPNFSFPKLCTRRRAFELWLVGMPNFKKENGDKAPVMPFRRMETKFLPKALAHKLSIEWKPIMNKMMEAPNLPDQVRNANLLTPQIIEAAYGISTSFLKTSVMSYVWENEKKYKNSASWKVGTWSKRVKYSEIKRNGTESDIANLPEPTYFNKPRQKRSRTSN
jgi:hypothetical protein